MARILILAPQLPYPPQQGTTLRNFNLIAGLARRGHVVDVATFEGSQVGYLNAEPGRPELGPLRDVCRTVVTVPEPRRSTAQRARDTLLHPLPDMALRLESRAMHERLAQLLAAQAPYDVVQVEGIEMAPYALAMPPAGRGQMVFDDHNAEYVLQHRAFLNDVRIPQRWPGAAYSLVQWQKLVRYERRICQTADRVVAVSDADRQAIERLLPGLEVTVIPNGVDLGFYRPDAVAPLTGMKQPAIVFTGKMDYRPNVDAVLWFVNEVLPLVQAEIPAAHFYVVGQQPHARLACLAGRQDVTVTGRVPDVRPYMVGASVYVVPLRIGGGTRLKVLEAMALGLPIVSTRLGCDGFPFVDDQEVRLADTPALFAGRVVELYRARDAATRLGQAARAYVAAHYGWDAIVPCLEQVYWL